MIQKTQYTINIFLRTNYNTTNIVSFNVRTGSTKGPVANIRGLEALNLKRFNGLQLNGSFAVIDCLPDAPLIRDRLVIEWFRRNRSEGYLRERILQKTISNTITEDQITIQPYTLQIGTFYEITLQVFQFTEPDSKAQSKIWFYVEPTPLTSSILGGNQMKELKETFRITSLASDPDEPPSTRTEGFRRTWTCLNLNNNLPCKDLTQKLIEVPENTSSYEVLRKTLEPFNSYNFVVNCNLKIIKIIYFIK